MAICIYIIIIYNVLRKDDKVNTAAHKHRASLSEPARLSLMTWKHAITGKVTITSSITIGRASICAFPENRP